MINFVTKKDGTRVPFKVEIMKQSIVAASLDAGLPAEQGEEIAKEVSDLVVAVLENQDEVSSAEIREKILVELEVLHPAVGDAWKKHEEIKEV